VKRLISATIHSLRGLRHTIANETAVRQEMITLGVAILLGLFLVTRLMVASAVLNATLWARRTSV